MSGRTSPGVAQGNQVRMLKQQDLCGYVHNHHYHLYSTLDSSISKHFTKEGSHTAIKQAGYLNKVTFQRLHSRSELIVQPRFLDFQFSVLLPGPCCLKTTVPCSWLLIVHFQPLVSTKLNSVKDFKLLG